MLVFWVILLENQSMPSLIQEFIFKSELYGFNFFHLSPKNRSLLFLGRRLGVVRCTCVTFKIKVVDHGFFSGQEGFNLVFGTILDLRAFNTFLG